ncbi:thiamine phosphate synthase [Flavobacteriales bacterium]|nr:thiamine phosphate synthase [Flavobacteriales bacterium]
MNIVVFSSANKLNSEIPHVIKMFEHGLSCFHLRKPMARFKELENYIQAIPDEYKNRIIVHSHHELANIYGLKGIHHSRLHRKKGISKKLRIAFNRLVRKKMKFTKSCHSLKSVNKEDGKYDYVFLSPVFDSISKNYHKRKFPTRDIEKTIKSTPQTIYALGGINPNNIEQAYRMGFDGIAVLGYIWESSANPVEGFLEIQKKINELSSQLPMAV